MALVGSRERTPEREKEMFHQPAGRGVYVPFAAVAEFDPELATEARIRLIDLSRASTITIAGGKVALNGDFTALFALSFRGINDLMMGISGLINVEKREKDAGVYLTEPFDPDRIPVVMIHGLSSSPLVWRTIATSLLGDPSIRKNYQFWYVYYPTGMPILESAASIRDEIAAIRKAYDPRGTSIASRHLVLVGYSMGGVIAQILSTSSGNRLWDAIATVPFDQAAIDSEDRAELEKLLFWKPVPGLDRTIFIATPHRGTRFADSRLAGIGGRLVRLPGGFLQFQIRMLDAVGEILQGDFATMGVMTGITSLSPSAPLYKALDGAPFAPWAKISFDHRRSRQRGVESIARMASLVIGAPTSLGQSRNLSYRPAMRRTSTQKPLPIFEEFFFWTLADTELTRVSPTSFKVFCQSYDVLPLAAHIVETIENVADKVNTEAAGFVFIIDRRRGRCRAGAGIEGTAIIANFDFKAGRAKQELNLNLMLKAVAVPVFDRVAHHLFDGKVRGKNNFPRGAVGLEEFRGGGCDPPKFVQVITYFKGESGHG